MKIRKFNENFENDAMKTARIKYVDFDRFNEKQLKSLLFCYNDGQGDLAYYNFEEINNMLKEDETIDVSKMSHSDKVKYLYDSEDSIINGNNSQWFLAKDSEFYELYFTED